MSNEPVSPSFRPCAPGDVVLTMTNPDGVTATITVDHVARHPDAGTAQFGGVSVTLAVCVPADASGYVDGRFREAETKVLGERLGTHWGNHRGSHRRLGHVITAPTAAAAIQQAQEIAAQAMVTIAAVAAQHAASRATWDAAAAAALATYRVQA